MKIFAIIAAGGKGIRSGFSTPKQYLKINNKEVILYCLETFQKNNYINEIIIASEPDYFDLLLRIIKNNKLSKVKLIVEGGLTRQQSVHNALLSLNADKNDLIVVHDAARALLPSYVLSNALNIAIKKGNAVVCLKNNDTLIKATKTISEFIDREEIFYVQTPQIFKYNILIKAYNNAYSQNLFATDESTLVKNLGKKVYLAEGSVFNFKITTNEDIQLFDKITKKN